MFSVPARSEVPEVMKRRRGLGAWRSNGMKVEVMICVPTVLTFQDWFHILRSVICPEASCWSNMAPVVGFVSLRKGYG